MKRLLYIALITALVVGCQNRYEPTPEDLENIEKTIKKISMEDSIEKAKILEEKRKHLEKQEAASSKQQSKRNSQKYKSEEYDEDNEERYETNEYDNMRGFDPLWEDDTKDNGMSRYMENYDEEGWY